ncbi:hypothetical protein B0T16DRAFT_455587 [Cercophora newfieldiana]|uniref:Uncharacterized protein n=1 Tax=Cercophora newfieldiana TaxID=92897 RepID=A0AA40CRL3_9PEZI|nr:hypothetical protein B0T16DRAFT_455587 [Cercophora newfieldiana]
MSSRGPEGVVSGQQQPASPFQLAQQAPVQPNQQTQQQNTTREDIELQEVSRTLNSSAPATTPQPARPPPEPPTATPSSAPISPIVSNSHANAAPTPEAQQSQPSQPSQPRITQAHNSPLTPSSSTPSAPKAQRPSWRKGVSDFYALILISCVFTFVTTISLGASFPDWVLARLSPTSGILLLSFMSKITDWGFGGATEKAWEMIQWGPLLHGRGGNLLSFLTLGSRFRGWVRVLTARWAWMPRLLVWVVVQFPGVILMSVVEPQLEYLPRNWTTVSGGIGIFNSSLVIQQIDGPKISNLVYSALQDPRFSTPADPISEDCKSSPNCTSYLMSGGLTTISPFPYLLRDPHLPAYTAQNVPSYQIDAWDLTETPIAFKGSECQLFKGVPSSDAISQGFYLCAKDESDSAIVAAFAMCTQNCVSLDNLRNRTFQTLSWATRISIHRRLVDFVADRRTETILSIGNLSDPILQHIPAADFRPAFETFLCIDGSNSSLCQHSGVNGIFTESVAWLTLPQFDQYSPVVGVLQNLFATSLYLYTPVYKRQIAVPGVGLPNTLLEGLLDENYFPGSLASPYEYVAPAQWTVIAYLASGVVLILLCSAATAVSSIMGAPEVSNFPGVDAVKLTLEDGNGADQPGGMARVFAAQQRDEEVMKTAVGLTVRLGGQGQGGLSTATTP